MARVTGIGGVFLRARDPRTLAAWYAQHLGIRPRIVSPISTAVTPAAPIR